MPKVAITGWTKGCDTIAAIKELREKAAIPLSDALALVNRILRNERVEVLVPTPIEAQRLVDFLKTIGMVVESISEEDQGTGADSDESGGL